MPEKTTKKTKRSAEEPEKKRRKVVNKEEEESDGVDEEQLKLELLRKHFESQFAPLEVETKKTKKEKSKKAEKKVEVEEDDMDDMRSDYGSSGEDDDESSGSDDDSELDELDWEGFGADSKEIAPKPIVVDLSSTGTYTAPPKLNHKAIKELTTIAASKPKPPPTRTTPKTEDDENESTNLKDDLELQRLLRESHLLSGDSLEATGRNRLKALESRVQALGGKDATIQKAPMHIAKGLKRAREDRETKRRREAKEAGIILEREERKSSKPVNRERGVGAPSIGRFKGGALIIGKDEVAAMTKSKSKSGGKGGKGGKGKRR